MTWAQRERFQSPYLNGISYGHHSYTPCNKPSSHISLKSIIPSDLLICFIRFQFLRFIFIYVRMCVSVYGYVPMSEDALEGQKKVSDLWELAFQAAVSSLT